MDYLLIGIFFPCVNFFRNIVISIHETIRRKPLFSFRPTYSFLNSP
jgi:hypothetical protein